MDYLLIGYFEGDMDTNGCNICTPASLDACIGLQAVRGESPNGYSLVISGCYLLTDLGGLGGLSGTLEGALYSISTNVKPISPNGLQRGSPA
jgi:hypothetical protein